MTTIVTNISYFDKTKEEKFRNIADNVYKISSWNKIPFTDVPGLIFGHTSFKDRELSISEAISMKNTLEKRIKELLEGRIPEKFDRPRIQFLGKDINLNTNPTGVNAQDISIFKLFKAFQIIEECLEENKPVFISNVDESLITNESKSV